MSNYLQCAIFKGCNNWVMGVQEYEIWRKLDFEASYTFFNTANLDTLIVYNNGNDAFQQCFRVKALEANTNKLSWSNEICLEFQHKIFIPNAFSPNSDGVNDSWIIESIGKYPENKLEIYNRWGNLVYSKDGYLNEWNGTSKEKRLPDATYFYIHKLNAGLTDIEDVYKGHVSIMR